MRARTFPTIVFLLAVLPLGGCLSSAARERALLPAMRQAWVGVRADALAGGATEAELTRMDESLVYGMPAAIAAAWPPVEAAARAALTGMSPGLAEFRGERIEKFTEAVEALSGHGE
jgi:hypothetical protein